MTDPRSTSVSTSSSTRPVTGSANARGHDDQLQQWRMTVTSVTRPAESVARVQFEAPEFQDYHPSGADESFGLIMPLVGIDFVMPSPDRANIRSALHEIPAEQRPELRWYSVTGHDQQSGRIEADLVLHGDAGPGTAWASRASVGDLVGFRRGLSDYVIPEESRSEVWLADETAAPALGSIVRWWEGRGMSLVGTRAVIEVPSSKYLALDLEDAISHGLQVEVLHRGTDAPGSHLMPYLAELDLSNAAAAWVAGESGLATSARRYLVSQGGLDRRAVSFSGYWKRGRARL